MIGAIAGDVIGSIHEHAPTKTTDFPLLQPGSRFTDDTVLTVATAHAILTGTPYDVAYRDIGRRYPDAGYGGMFCRWLFAPEPRPYNSWGNGSAMRVSPVGFAFESEEEVLREAKASASVTHDHPEGIRGAQATALAGFLARTGATKKKIRSRITERFGYDLDRTVRKSGRRTASMSPARARSLRRSSPSWTPRTSRVRSGSPSPSAATRTRRRPSPAGSPRRTTAVCRPRSPVRSSTACRPTCSRWWSGLKRGIGRIGSSRAI